ncbi:MAG: hypothetical protein LUE89_09465 [Clostridiales bacterium]|nr:hypothetical protein [Clostridiales bacterium]
MSKNELMPTNAELQQAADTMERFRVAEFGTEEEKLRASLPEFLYHITTEKNCKEILEDMVIYSTHHYINDPEVDCVFFGEFPNACSQMAGATQGLEMAADYWRRQEKAGLLRPALLELYEKHFGIVPIYHSEVRLPVLKIPSAWLDPAKLTRDYHKRLRAKDGYEVEWIYHDPRGVELLEKPEIVWYTAPGYTELVFGSTPDRRSEVEGTENVEE